MSLPWYLFAILTPVLTWAGYALGKARLMRSLEAMTAEAHEQGRFIGAADARAAELREEDPGPV